MGLEGLGLTLGWITWGSIMFIRKVINTINRKMDKRMMGALGGIRIPAPERDSARKEITAPMAEMGSHVISFLGWGTFQRTSFQLGFLILKREAGKGWGPLCHLD